MGCCLEAETVVNDKEIVSKNNPISQPQKANQPSAKLNTGELKKQPAASQNKRYELLKNLKAKFDQLNLQKNKLSDDIATLKHNKSLVQDQLKGKRQEQKGLDADFQKKKNKIAQLNKQLIIIKDQIEKETGLVTVQPQVAVKQQSQNLKSSQVQQLKQAFAKSQQEIQQRRKLVGKEEGQKQKMRQKMNEISPQIQSIQEKMAELAASISNKKLEQQKVQTLIASVKTSSEKQLSELVQLRRCRQENKERLMKIKREIEESKIQTALLNSQNKQQPKINLRQQKLASLFAGNLLEGLQKEKEYLVGMLQDRLKSKIKGTKQIYSYDPLNKNNFHLYIDNKGQIVVILRLTNGQTLGAWSEGMFQPKMVSDKDGLIFSLTNRQCFEPLERNRRAITYDDYFLIFGNSELRLKSQETKVFSNFAISNGYYNARGSKVDVLLGCGTIREVQMEGLQVFQLIME